MRPTYIRPHWASGFLARPWNVCRTLRKNLVTVSTWLWVCCRNYNFLALLHWLRPRMCIRPDVNHGHHATQKEWSWAFLWSRKWKKMLKVGTLCASSASQRKKLFYLKTCVHWLDLSILRVSIRGLTHLPTVTVSTWLRVRCRNYNFLALLHWLRPRVCIRPDVSHGHHATQKD